LNGLEDVEVVAAAAAEKILLIFLLLLDQANPHDD